MFVPGRNGACVMYVKQEQIVLTSRLSLWALCRYTCSFAVPGQNIVTGARNSNNGKDGKDGDFDGGSSKLLSDWRLSIDAGCFTHIAQHRSHFEFHFTYTRRIEAQQFELHPIDNVVCAHMNTICLFFLGSPHHGRHEIHIHRRRDTWTRIVVVIVVVRRRPHAFPLNYNICAIAKIPIKQLYTLTHSHNTHLYIGFVTRKKCIRDGMTRPAHLLLARFDDDGDDDEEENVFD